MAHSAYQFHRQVNTMLQCTTIMNESTPKILCTWEYNEFMNSIMAGTVVVYNDRQNPIHREYT